VLFSPEEEAQIKKENEWAEDRWSDNLGFVIIGYW
jgi:hypothetical protein